MLKAPPISLYVHVPWCVKKCPYCDFNSHQVAGGIPEKEYVDALLRDFENELHAVQGRQLHSIFIGGGTPSLMSANAYDELFKGLKYQIDFADNIEITMEANPGTYEHGLFESYINSGVNRLSIGVQSFQDEKLASLGRIHSADEARQAIVSIRRSGFNNINIDLMHGLPGQSLEDAMHDLQQAIALKPAHISWYQLTIEPNTLFYTKTPRLPPDDILWTIHTAGQDLLESQGFKQYEISAYCLPGQSSRHNLNYWMFGDYIGIGAGAHGKLTNVFDQKIYRNWKTRIPRNYMAAIDYIFPGFEAGRRILNVDELPIEFLMNALRLKDGVDVGIYNERTGQNLTTIDSQLEQARQKGLLEPASPWNVIKPTHTGRLFLNNLLELFT